MGSWDPVPVQFANGVGICRRPKIAVSKIVPVTTVSSLFTGKATGCSGQHGVR
jgi:hypothetical protein